MGLASTNDCWCARSDIIIVSLENVSKIVDDILVTAKTMEELFSTIAEVLTRCRKQGLTISSKKLQVGSTLPFAGYSLSPTGVSPDSERVHSIRNFPSPTDVTTVRSFLGLANQLGHFLPDLATSTTRIRGLLKKGTAFNWLPEHELEFVAVKNLLTSPLLSSFITLTPTCQRQFSLMLRSSTALGTL